jgi:hypothetical protein
MTLAHNHSGVILNNEFKYLLSITNLGFTILVIMVHIALIHIIVAVIAGKLSSKIVIIELDSSATGIVISPLKGIGIINNTTPINEGIINRNTLGAV